MSSLTSVLGGIGHAAYASSNVYMDSFVRRHNRSHSVPWLSVNFDLWRFHNRSAISPASGKPFRNWAIRLKRRSKAMETVLAVEERQPTPRVDRRSGRKNQPMDQAGIAEGAGNGGRARAKA